MIEMDDPFVYKTFEELRKQKKREYDRKRKERILGRPLGKHGGYRPGSGRKRKIPWTDKAFLFLTRIQKQILIDMGKGDLSKGVQALIKELV